MYSSKRSDRVTRSQCSCERGRWPTQDHHEESSLHHRAAHLAWLAIAPLRSCARYLSTTEMANGFGNRILWVCVQRSKCLPEGGRVDLAALSQLQVAFPPRLSLARTWWVNPARRGR